ncbi:MAG: hypothetical protein ACKOEM_04380 [Planctomycetia bacterium]
MPLSRPRLSGPVVDATTVAGIHVQQARWTVAWPEDTTSHAVGNVLATRLAPLTGEGPLNVFDADAAPPAALLNTAALRLALRLHSRSGPEFAGFVASAPHGADSSGFGFCFIDPVVASLAAEWAVKVVHDAARGDALPADPLGEASLVLGRIFPGTDSARVLLEASRRGIPITRLTDHAPAYRLGDGSRQATLFRCFTHRTPQVASVLTTSKATTTQILSRLGFPVPLNQPVGSLDEARAFVSRIGYPVVVKPNASDFGQGVTAEIRDDRQLAAAFARARPMGDVLVEQHIAGENYRLLVIDGICRGVNHRVQPDVIGDGARTIAALMLAKASTMPKYPRPDDPVVAGFLEGLGRRIDDVPAPGERVRISAVANASAGGTRVDVTDRVHPENKRLAEAVAAAFGIDLAGIDLITPDITRPWQEAGGAINEVNVNPGLPFPAAPGWVLDGLFPDGSNGRVDVTVIVGHLSGADVSTITGWVRRGRTPASRNAILGRPTDAGGGRNPLDPAAARPIVEQLLGRAELDSLVVQIAWPGTGPVVSPAPYQSRVLVNPGVHELATAIARLRNTAAYCPPVPVSGFDIRAFERG